MFFMIWGVMYENLGGIAFQAKGTTLAVCKHHTRFGPD